MGSYDVVSARSYIAVHMNSRNTLQNEWHDKNEKLFTAYTNGSGFKAWWKCLTCAFEWQATICNRIGRGSNCPNCRKINSRGKNNPKWSGHEEISGRQWLYTKREAERRHLQFAISIEYAWELYIEQERKCIFTGRELVMSGKRNGKQTGSASLDRKDTSKGFVIGNVQWIHKELQHTKRNLSDKDFIRICEEVAMYQIKKKVESVMPPTFKTWTAEKKLR